MALCELQVHILYLVALSLLRKLPSWQVFGNPGSSGSAVFRYSRERTRYEVPAVPTQVFLVDGQHAGDRNSFSYGLAWEPDGRRLRAQLGPSSEWHASLSDMGPWEAGAASCVWLSKRRKFTSF